MKIVLVNGPPRCGKDTVARILKGGFKAHIHSFARVLKEMVHALYGLNVPFDYFEDRKDEPAPELHGILPRRAYIQLSEHYWKPLHGKWIFGQLFLDQIKGSHFPLVVVPDSGFREEAEILVDYFGPDTIRLLRVHRPKCGFESDSRSYITLDGVQDHDLANDGTLDQLKERVIDWALSPQGIV